MSGPDQRDPISQLNREILSLKERLERVERVFNNESAEVRYIALRDARILIAYFEQTNSSHRPEREKTLIENLRHSLERVDRLDEVTIPLIEKPA
jgi:hypothetical protein